MGRLQEMWEKMGDQLGTPSQKDDRVVIIDSLNTFLRVFSAVPALNDDGQHVGGVIGFLKSVGANIRQFQATRCILVFDGAGGSQKRRKILPEYKGNRKNRVRFNRFDDFKDLVDERESMKIQFSRLSEYFDTLPITVISIDNIEADDSIAYIAKQYYEGVDNQITIVSTDKDYLQLTSDKIRVWNPVKKKMYTPQVVSEEFGIHHENYLLYRILSGDKSDNIDGIGGVGLKTMIKNFPTVVDTPMTITQFINESEQKYEENPKKKFFKNILDNREILNRNNSLMQLHEVDISTANKMAIQSLMDKEINRLDMGEFRKLFVDDKLYANIKNVDSWLRDTFVMLNTYATRKTC